MGWWRGGLGYGAGRAGLRQGSCCTLHLRRGQQSLVVTLLRVDAATPASIAAGGGSERQAGRRCAARGPPEWHVPCRLLC